MADRVFHANNEIAVHVDDLADARRFYGDVLGFELEDESEEGLAFRAGPHLLYVIPNEESVPPILSMSTGDLAKARAALEEGGAEILKEGDGGLYFEDPFGIVWDVVVRIPESE